MYSDADIEAAIAAGAIEPGAAARLRAFVAAERRVTVVDEEHFRLITGFNDLFVSIAAVLLLAAVGWIGQALIGGSAPSPLAGGLVAATAWGLAEFFTRRRRMALPSIVLLLAFVGGVFGCIAGAIVQIVGVDGDVGMRAGAVYAAIAAAGTAGGAWAHWRRFRVPITVAAGAAAAAGLALALVLSAVPGADEAVYPLLFAAGIGVFGVAMWWDVSDPRRETRRADVAFWLHLLAAPLIVHPVFHMLGLLDGGASVGEALTVVALYVALGGVALAIDRRALMVSALAYVLFALSELFKQFGAVSLSLALTALVIGSALLLLSAFWHGARGRVLALLPETLRARLPATERIAPAAATHLSA